MLEIALLTLTLTSDGAVRLTMSEMESMAECHASRTRITEILDASGIKVISALCGETGLKLTPFEHGAGPDDEKHLFRVEIDGQATFAVVPIAKSDDCVADPEGSPQVFCTRSSQSVISKSQP
ncbi:MAG: hypothetical protein AAGA50_27130 [Pseudomonadota bacterium]